MNVVVLSLITIPVVLGLLAASGLFAVALGFMPLNRMIPRLLFQKRYWRCFFVSSFLSSRNSTGQLGSGAPDEHRCSVTLLTSNHRREAMGVRDIAWNVGKWKIMKERLGVHR